LVPNKNTFDVRESVHRDMIKKVTNKMQQDELKTEFSTHAGHQPAATWVNTTKSCKYSQVLLIMGENIARNM
jgi:hypothetical protein